MKFSNVYAHSFLPVSYLEKAFLAGSAGHTWEGGEWQVGVCVMATTDQNPIKDQALLFAICLHDHIPLSADSKVWAPPHMPHLGLRREHRRKHR